MKTYVKKIWSLNPSEYEYITLEIALKRYDSYLDYYRKEEIHRWSNRDFKSFQEWLDTEI